MFKSTLPLINEEQQAFKKVSIRKFVVPSINMNATTYPDLFNWAATEFWSFPWPPLSGTGNPLNDRSSQFSYWSRFTGWIYLAKIEVSKGCWLLWVREKPVLEKRE